VAALMVRAVLVAVLTVTAAGTLGRLVVRRRDDANVERRLRPWAEGAPVAPPVGVTALPGGSVPHDTSVLAAPARVVERAAGGLLGRHRGFGQWISSQLVRAQLAATATEVVAAALVVAVSGLVVGIMLGAGVVVAVVGGAVVGLVPLAVVGVAASRRQRRFAADLPDVLALLAGSLRAGFPLDQALRTVATEAGGPVGTELRRVAAETALGRTLPEALTAAGERMASDDIAWVGVAVEIHQQAGGNLAEVLDTVAATVAGRQQLRREVASLTAEGRLSAVVLGLLPPGLAVVISVVNPGYLAALLGETEGRVLVVSSLAAMLVGFWWMQRIVRIEV
jgi:tight adherence protein B